MDAGIGINEDALGGKALGTVAGDGVAVVEVTIIAGIELELAMVVEASRKPPIGMDGPESREVAISNAERFVGRRELDTVAHACSPSNTAQRPQPDKTQDRRLPVLRPGFSDYLDAAATARRYSQTVLRYIRALAPRVPTETP